MSDLTRSFVSDWHRRAVALGADGVENVIFAAEVAKRRGELHTVDGFISKWVFPGSAQDRLSLAAPDLLKALNAMLTHMGMDEDEWNKGTFDQARAAIAKAAPTTNEGEPR